VPRLLNTVVTAVSRKRKAACLCPLPRRLQALWGPELRHGPDTVVPTVRVHPQEGVLVTLDRAIQDPIVRDRSCSAHSPLLLDTKSLRLNPCRGRRT